MSAGSFFETHRSWIMSVAMILLLIVAVSRTNYGLWDADIPLGDDAIYIEQAYRLLEQEEMSTSLYLNTYLLVLSHISSDPILAHYCVRYLSSLLSSLALFLLLSSLPLVTRLGALVMALFWSLNLLNSPLVQYVSINLFAFALVCLTGYLWLSGGRYGKVAAIVLLLAVVVMRYEYALLLLFLGLQQTWHRLSPERRESLPRQRLVQAGSAVAVVVLLVVLAVCAASPELRNRASRNVADLNAYFFLGFTQHYSIFTVTRDATLHIDPYTEYDLLIGERFPGATDFLSAVQANPGEVASYLARNFMANLTRIHYVLPSHSVLLPSGLVTNGMTGRFGTGEFVAKKFPVYPLLWLEQAVSVLFIAAGTLWLLARNRRDLRPRKLVAHDNAAFVLGMAAVVSVSFILHIPDPRYWIMLIPLLFWGPAALISAYGDGHHYGATLGWAVLASLVIVNPVFTSTMNRAAHMNKDVVLALRNEMAKAGPHVIRALGYYPQPLMIFAVPGRGVCTDNREVSRHASYEELVRAGDHDLVIVDTLLQNTRQYRSEIVFLDKLHAHPEDYGYALLLASADRNGPVRIYRKIPS